jgi:hypothetical protein
MRAVASRMECYASLPEVSYDLLASAHNSCSTMGCKRHKSVPSSILGYNPEVIRLTGAGYLEPVVSHLRILEGIVGR